MASVITVTAFVTVKSTPREFLNNISVTTVSQRFLCDAPFVDPFKLQLVSSVHVDNSPLIKPIGKLAKLANDYLGEESETTYEVDLYVDENFGEVGAITAENQHLNEMYVKDIVLKGLPQGEVKVICNSWVHSKYDNPKRRVFFINKAYLLSQTPPGLQSLRAEELESLRGNGEGERKAYDRIYDYDTYNDLGNPDDQNKKLLRPVLGGNDLPYPRRCRTGRPPTNADPSSEQRVKSFYVPRDEDFSATKEKTFTGDNSDAYSISSSLQNFFEKLFPHQESFKSFRDIYELFREGFDISHLEQKDEIANQHPHLFPYKDHLRFPTPALMDRDEFAWFRDEEFARETLAGLNPYAIKLVTEWPLESKLDPEVYGCPKSAITKAIIEQQIKGIMSFDEALEQEKLFMLDYHDVLLPYVNKVRELKGCTLYGSRTLFFLVPQGTLKPVAIELTRPPTDDGKPQWKQVFTPSCLDNNGTEAWLWKLAKAHVLAHDSGYHQLISHWLRTHCCVEPYIIATNRQLSSMHPIYKLLKPHFRFTMKINAFARQSLINAGGIIESSFCMGRYSVELSSVVYGQEWRFDQEGLPADLIRRGMAVEDPTSPHGLKLTIEDYPFANDGLILWDAIKQWVTDYVNHYYATNETLIEDFELQAWWEEIRNKGHPDKKDESWWPVLETRTALIDILCTMIWVASGHHAAVNFGQYAHAGYIPNRPTIARIKMPSEDSTKEAWNKFVQKPDDHLLQTFPSKKQAIKVMAVLSVLSDHSPDEEYIAEKIEPYCLEEDLTIRHAFTNFNAELMKLDSLIDKRNGDLKLKNRNGAGILPYTLLKPFSKPGITGMGVPNSISI